MLRWPFPLRTSEPKPGGRAIDISLLNVPVAAGREHLIFCLGRPQRQGQCHRLRDDQTRGSPAQSFCGAEDRGRRGSCRDQSDGWTT
jgi:hypothetical protein